MKQIDNIIFHIHINPSIVENIRNQCILIQLKYYFCAISRPQRQILEKKPSHLIISQWKGEKHQKSQSTKSHCMSINAAVSRESHLEEETPIFGSWEVPTVAVSLSLSLNYFCLFVWCFCFSACFLRT